MCANIYVGVYVGVSLQVCVGRIKEMASVLVSSWYSGREDSHCVCTCVGYLLLPKTILVEEKSNVLHSCTSALARACTRECVRVEACACMHECVSVLRLVHVSVLSSVRE